MRSWQGLAKHVRDRHRIDIYHYHRESEEARLQLCERIKSNTEMVPPPEGYGLEQPCWRWKGRLARGYGQIRLTGSPTEMVHRVSWWIHRGDPLNEPSPEGDVTLMHQCDRSDCVNPEHLEPGDHAENMAERRARGRHLTCHASELTEEQVHQIRHAARRGDSHREIGERYGKSSSAIGHIVAGRSFGHIVTPPDWEDALPF